MNIIYVHNFNKILEPNRFQTKYTEPNIELKHSKDLHQHNLHRFIYDKFYIIDVPKFSCNSVCVHGRLPGISFI